MIQWTGRCCNRVTGPTSILEQISKTSLLVLQSGRASGDELDEA